MAAILYRYAEVMDLELPSVRTGSFNDEAQIRGWALREVNAMYEARILSGRGGGIFDPQAGATSWPEYLLETLKFPFYAVLLSPMTVSFLTPTTMAQVSMTALHICQHLKFVTPIIASLSVTSDRLRG